MTNDHYLSQGSFERNRKRCGKWSIKASEATRGHQGMIALMVSRSDFRAEGHLFESRSSPLHSVLIDKTLTPHCLLPSKCVNLLGKLNY